MLSLTGVHPIDYPPGLWLSIDRREADLQDVFNEPWSFIEGCLRVLFALTALQPSSRQRWRRSAVVACLLAAAVGLLSGLGAIPTMGRRPVARPEQVHDGPSAWRGLVLAAASLASFRDLRRTG